MQIENQYDKNFLHSHRDFLVKLFNKRIEELKDQVINMEQGIERDATIEMVREFQRWIRKIEDIKNDAVKDNFVDNHI